MNTQFNQLQLLFKQLFNLADEIKILIENEDYNELLNKVQYKETILETLTSTKKSAMLNEEDEKMFQELEIELKQKEQDNIKLISTLKEQLSSELFKTNKNLKLNSAYKKASDANGSILDISE